jgi:glyoxylase-like metal-dependent hydrolase (beta-lactamase superfamily II)
MNSPTVIGFRMRALSAVRTGRNVVLHTLIAPGKSAFYPIKHSVRKAVEKGRQLTTLLSIAVFLVPAVGLSSADEHPTQAPGYYKFRVGDFEVTALLDGTHPFPAADVLMHRTLDNTGTRVKLFADSAAVTKARLAAAFVGLPPEGSINAFLINTGRQLILVDSGAGTLYGDCCGRLIGNLRAAGYEPEQVDQVLLTHLHADHVGGIAPNGIMAFTNATIRVAQADLEYWTDTKQAKMAPAYLKPMFTGAVTSLRPYLAANRVSTFDARTELLPGIVATPAPGHTPGHTVYQITSRDRQLMIWGDIVHVAALQFSDPAITLIYDSDEDQAEVQRIALFKKVSDGRILVAAAHIAFPGVGHVARQEARFVWIPAEYTTRVTVTTP